MQNLEEQALSLVGRDVYEKLVKGYTEKQWGRDCRDLPAFIIKRLPLSWCIGVPHGNPINDAKNSALYAEYAKLAAQEKNVIFGGRLGEYKYYDMDKVIESALKKVRE